MNCLDIRRHLLADPNSHDEAIHSHIKECVECARFANDLMAFESDLNHASKVEVPEGLASRILLRQRLSVEQKRRKQFGMATAAVFLLGFVVVISGFLTNGSGGSDSQSLAQVVLQHVNDELHHLQDHKNLSIQQLNSVLENHGNKFKALPGRTINYAGACPIRDRQGAHVIVGSPSGPITVLFMPGEFVGERAQLQDERFQGVIIPTEQGSMAIIAEDPQQIHGFRRP